MAGKWSNFKSEEHQIFYRTQTGRKHGVRLDRYRVIRHSPYGKQISEALGWESDGWTLQNVRAVRNRLQEARRTGQGPRTLAEERESNERAAREQAEQEAARERRERTVADLWDRYLKEVVAIANKLSTTEEKTRMWTRRIEPAIGRLKINDVTQEDVGRIVRSPLRLDSKGQAVGGAAEAGNLYRLQRHMFNKALLWNLRAREAGNPLTGVSEPKVARRERLLTAGEIGALMKALDAAETDGAEPPQIIAVIRLVILTGARIGELLNLRWRDIRRDEFELHLRHTKTGFSRRPISAAVLALLDRVACMPGADFVFHSATAPRQPLTYSVAEKAFRRIAGCAGVDCTLHTIRHWFSTMTANSVANPRIGMSLTGHKSHSAYLTYIHGDKTQARALADQLAALATGLGKATDSNIIIMPPTDTAK